MLKFLLSRNFFFRNELTSFRFFLVLVVLIYPALVHAQQYELLIKGGHVIDVENDIRGRYLSAY